MPDRTRILLLSIACTVLAGCDFRVPLADTPELAIDSRAIGLWERTKPDGKSERLPLNDHEYFVSWPEGAHHELFASAHLVEFSGKTLVQIKRFGASDGTVPDDDRVFRIATYAQSGDELEIRLLDAEVIGKDFRSSADLARVVEAHGDNPTLFRDKMVFNRIRT
jgi:hypothetical protein